MRIGQPRRRAARRPARESLRRGIYVLPSLFTVGNFLYGRMGLALLLLAVFIVSGLVLLYVINQLWAHSTACAAAAGNRAGKATP